MPIHPQEPQLQPQVLSPRIGKPQTSRRGYPFTANLVVLGERKRGDYVDSKKRILKR
jgi:hypothetical protein